MRLKLLFVLILLFKISFSTAQLIVDFPAERSVFQRNNFNEGDILVQGTTNHEADRVDARLIPVQEDQGVATNWKTIDSDLFGGSFSGKIGGTGGWYQLEIRVWLNDVIIETYTVSKVGIGEVFMVSGQSNAQGFLLLNPQGSTDDRVNGYSEYQTALNEDPSLAAFSPIERELDIGPRGQSAWAWGELGDKLAAKLNVPILFYNSAFEGTKVENWLSSINGQTTVHPGYGFTFPLGQPYDYMRIIFQNHVPVYGLRAVIWIQGENDFETLGTDYYNQLKSFVEQVNINTGFNVPWILSRTSLIFNTVYPQIIESQNKVIANLSNVYPGPVTDNIQNPRGDGVHFSNSGISDLASSFDELMTEEYLANIQPLSPKDIIPLKVECLSNGIVRFSTEKSGMKHIWNGGQEGDSLIISEGFASATVEDNFGNKQLTEKMNVEGVFPPAPVVEAIDGLVACEGDVLSFTTDSNADYTTIWPDESESDNYYSSSSELVFAYNKNSSECLSIVSFGLQTDILVKPETPTISSSTGSFATCESQPLILKAESTESDFIWSNGGNTTEISISEVGENSYSVKAFSAEGCESEFSEPQLVNVYKTPEAPEIDRSGPYSLNVINGNEQDKYEWKLNDEVIDSENNQGLLALSNGLYSVSRFELHPEPFSILCKSYESGLFNFEKDESINGLKVFPNPVLNGEIYLTSDKVTNAVVYKLIDYQGKTIVHPGTIEDLSLPIKIQLPQGATQGNYILILNYEGLEKRFKLNFR